MCLVKSRLLRLYSILLLPLLYSLISLILIFLIIVPRYSLWGAIRGIWSRKERRRFSSIEEGIYLDDLDNGVMGDEERALYLPSVAKNIVYVQYRVKWYCVCIA